MERQSTAGPLAQAAGRKLGVALYFFHLCDGCDVLMDPEGREIADVALIPDVAFREARAMISHDALGGRIKLDQHIEVRDEAGGVVHQLAFRDAVKLS